MTLHMCVCVLLVVLLLLVCGMRTETPETVWSCGDECRELFLSRCSYCCLMLLLLVVTNTVHTARLHHVLVGRLVV